jgi:hypothetical protein
MNKHQNANGVPKLNIAMPSPASDSIDIDPFIIEGIWMLNLKFQKQNLLMNPCQPVV